MITPVRDELSALASDAAAAWPEVILDRALFAARLAAVLERVPGANVRCGELYLATACAEGVPEAHAKFEAIYMPAVASVVRRVLRSDEANRVQEMRVLLLLGRSGKGPLIGRYDGLGSLASWLRIVVLREALASASRRAPPGAVGDDALLEDVASSSDQELEYLRQLYQPEFKRAFQLALGSLEAAERNLLRYAFVEGLDAASLGRILRVHRTTAWRQLVRVQETLLDRTKQHLLETLDVGPMELESILRLVRSQLTFSLSRLLADT